MPRGQKQYPIQPQHIDTGLLAKWSEHQVTRLLIGDSACVRTAIELICFAQETDPAEWKVISKSKFWDYQRRAFPDTSLPRSTASGLFSSGLLEYAPGGFLPNHRLIASCFLLTPNDPMSAEPLSPRYISSEVLEEMATYGGALAGLGTILFQAADNVRAAASIVSYYHTYGFHETLAITGEKIEGWINSRYSNETKAKRIKAFQYLVANGHFVVTAKGYHPTHQFISRCFLLAPWDLSFPEEK
ncbi:MAG: hypothetical protein WCT32_03690 [Patescibacteria group bacterium]|jgi:hypothetical protein